jgi:hypothetical protein
MNDLSPVGKPKIRVALVGEDGNAFSIMGRVSRAMRKNGYTNDEVEKYTKEAMAGDYDHLLQVTMSYVEDCGTDKCDDCGGDSDDCGGNCYGGEK